MAHDQDSRWWTTSGERESPATACVRPGPKLRQCWLRSTFLLQYVSFAPASLPLWASARQNYAQSCTFTASWLAVSCPSLKLSPLVPTVLQHHHLRLTEYPFNQPHMGRRAISISFKREKVFLQLNIPSPIRAVELGVHLIMGGTSSSASAALYH